MSFSINGIRISLSLITFSCVLFFFNQKSKFIVPVRHLKQNYWFMYNILLGLLLFCVILLPLRISFVSDKQVVVEKNIPIQIVLDVSLSMAANDLSPSRFVAAKTSLISLIQQLDGYSISLITFSGKPFVYIPFSSSSSAIINKLQTMNLGDFPPVPDFLGTAIGDALLLGTKNLQQFVHQETYTPGIVILITDGDSNIGFDPMQVVTYYKKTQVPLFVLGVGQEDYLIGRDIWDSDVTTNINLPLLQQLADTTGGEFYRILGEKSFDEFFAKISQNILSRQHQKIQNIFWELNDYLMYFIFFFLLLLFSFKLFLHLTKRP
ncbi:MAG TPA: VWA domain-containing protein [Candidatus Absconditabacterales bacterium]|nr:VWA domain-containing protein [Candidatus Absconditabacterales bacterium]